jgi:hypothetical protein
MPVYRLDRPTAGRSHYLIIVSERGDWRAFVLDQASPTSPTTVNRTPSTAESARATLDRYLAFAPPAPTSSEDGLRERRAANSDHGQIYRQARAASTRRLPPRRPAPEPFFAEELDLDTFCLPSPELVFAEALDLAVFKRSLGSAPAAQFTSEGGLRGWREAGCDSDYCDTPVVEPEPRRPANRHNSRGSAAGRRSGGSRPRPRQKPRPPTEWELRRREHQVADAMRAAVVLTVYSAAAFCWWLATMG